MAGVFSSIRFPYRRLKEDGTLDSFLDTTIPFSETFFPVWDGEKLNNGYFIFYKDKTWRDYGYVPWPYTGTC